MKRRRATIRSRDLEVVTRHGLVNVDLSREIYARTLLGITEQVTPMF